MLEVQKYLNTPGKSLQTLDRDFGIKVTVKDHLAKFSYDQYRSQKLDPIVAECRGLVLNSQTFQVVGSCFKRFFNVGECPEYERQFDWSRFNVYTKEDGSWISIFFDEIQGRWQASTRSSFAEATIYNAGPTWSELAFSLLGDRVNRLDRNCTYIFELCSMHNKVVRMYREPKLILLGVIDNLHQLDHGDDFVDQLAQNCGFDRPARFQFTTVTEIREFLERNSITDPTFEGVVVRDRNGMRLKLKSLSYTTVHLLRGEGNNIYTPKYLLPCVIKGETDELLTYFPEIAPNLAVVSDIFYGAIESTQTLWDQARHIEDQKELARLLKESDHPFAHLIFAMKREEDPSVENTFRRARFEFSEDPTYRPNGKEIAQSNLFWKLVDMSERAIRERLGGIGGPAGFALQ